MYLNSTDLWFNSVNVILDNDNRYVKWGEDQDCGITYNGMDMLFYANLVGAGIFKFMDAAIQVEANQINDSGGLPVLQFDGSQNAGFTGALQVAGNINALGNIIIASGFVLDCASHNAAISPGTLADGDAGNNSIYYSSTQGKLIYKDSGGTVHDLY
jgi:hypothetical protein